MAQQRAKTPDKSSTLDDILAELESRFGSSADKSAAKKPIKKKSFLSSAQSFYAALGLVLLIIGAGIATFLTQRQQDLRQQAEVAPYECAARGGNCQTTVPCGSGYNHYIPGDSSCEIVGGVPQICCIPDTNGACDEVLDNSNCVGANPGDFGCTKDGVGGGTCTDMGVSNGKQLCICTIPSPTPTPRPQCAVEGECLDFTNTSCCNGFHQVEDSTCGVSGIRCEPDPIELCTSGDNECLDKNFGDSCGPKKTCTNNASTGGGECICQVDISEVCGGYGATCVFSSVPCYDGSDPLDAPSGLCTAPFLMCCNAPPSTPRVTVSPSIIVSPPATSTPTPGQGGGPTNTPVPPTNTPRPTNTPTPRPTNTPTRTPTPTNTPTPLADLELIKRVSNTSPIVGGIITYTIELTNKGPNDATNIVVADTTLFEALGLEFIPGSLSLSHGTVNYATGEWNIPLLRVNEVATLSADVRVLTVGTKFNQAEVRDVDQEDPDSTPGNIGEPGHEDEDDEDSAVVNPVEPSATATPAPLCLNITMTNPFRGNGEPTQIGDNVTFTCGEVSFAQRYEFRVQLPNGTIITLNPTASGARISEPFSLSQTGQYKAQCRICNDVAGNFCGEWESL